MHFAAYKRLRESYAWLLHQALAGQRPPQLAQAAIVYVRRRGELGLDWDNLYGGLKPLQDCLVAPSKRSPTGLHIIEDDSPRHMPFAPFVFQGRAEAGEGSTEVFVFDLGKVAVQNVASFWLD